MQLTRTNVAWAIANIHQIAEDTWFHDEDVTKLIHFHGEDDFNNRHQDSFFVFPREDRVEFGYDEPLPHEDNYDGYERIPADPYGGDFDKFEADLKTFFIQRLNHIDYLINFFQQEIDKLS